MIIDDKLGTEDDLLLPMGGDDGIDDDGDIIVDNKPELPDNYGSEEKEAINAHAELFSLVSVIKRELKDNPRPDSTLIRDLLALHTFDEPGFVINMVSGPSENNHMVLTKAMNMIDEVFKELLGKYKTVIDNKLDGLWTKASQIDEDKLEAIELLSNYLSTKSSKIMTTDGSIVNVLQMPYNEAVDVITDMGLWVDDISILNVLINDVMDMGTFNIKDITSFLLDLYRRSIAMRDEVEVLKADWDNLDAYEDPNATIANLNRIEVLDAELSRTIKYTVTNNAFGLINDVFRNYV